MVVRIWINILALLIGLFTISSAVDAQKMPDVKALQVLIGKSPIPVTVIEPHLSTINHPVKVVYEGYSANDVLTAVFGRKWASNDRDIEFVAADGYVSRIALAKFKNDHGFIVFARQDGKPFVIDNQFQQEANVALGPYYLVWDNTDSGMIVVSATHWPYQIVGISQVVSAESVLLPGKLKIQYQKPALLAQDLCLTCHQVNGYGGTKMPLNLAARVKLMSESYFMDWVLNPRSVKPNTHMPAFSPELPEKQRQAIAKLLYEYLCALPTIQ